MKKARASPVTRWRVYIQLREYVYAPTLGLLSSASLTRSRRGKRAGAG